MKFIVNSAITCDVFIQQFLVKLVMPSSLLSMSNIVDNYIWYLVETIIIILVEFGIGFAFGPKYL